MSGKTSFLIVGAQAGKSKTAQVRDFSLQMFTCIRGLHHQAPMFGHDDKNPLKRKAQLTIQIVVCSLVQK